MSTSIHNYSEPAISAPDYELDENMAKWTIPSTTKGEVNRAGQVLVEGSLFAGLPPIDRAEVLNTINNWRSSHGYPQHIAKKTLQTRAKRIDEHSICAQRLKRLPSIISKLRRNRNMKLSQMQDIGGCRAIMPTIGDLRDLITISLHALTRCTVITF